LKIVCVIIILVELEQSYSVNEETLPNGKQEMGKTTRWGIVFVVIFLLLLSLGGTVFFINQRTSFYSRATDPVEEHSGVVSLENCYIFASPLQARIGGDEKIRVTVFILDDSGKGVLGKTVFLTNNPKLVVSAAQPVSDDLGRAFFDVSSSSAGEFILQASVGSQTLPQEVKVTFN